MAIVTTGPFNLSVIWLSSLRSPLIFFSIHEHCPLGSKIYSASLKTEDGLAQAQFELRIFPPPFGQQLLQYSAPDGIAALSAAITSAVSSVRGRWEGERAFIL